MSSTLDAFVETAQFAPHFIEESYVAHDRSGNWRIPDDARTLLGNILGLSEGGTAAYAYLAALRAEEQYEDLECDVMGFNGGGMYE
jgi:hypothetical protein